MDEAIVHRGRVDAGPVNPKGYVSRLCQEFEQPRTGGRPSELLAEQGWPPCPGK